MVMLVLTFHSLLAYRLMELSNGNLLLLLLLLRLILFLHFLFFRLLLL